MGSKKRPQVILVGNPNVGKSALFNQLTHKYVSVSNYPGTTVSVSKGTYTKDETEVEVLDLPGLYSLLPITDDERVARKVIFESKDSIIVNVIDAKNIDRMLNLTVQLLELDRKVVLDLNIMDEAERAGIEIRTEALSNDLQVPVVKTVSISGKGIDQLREVIHGLC